MVNKKRTIKLNTKTFIIAQKLKEETIYKKGLNMRKSKKH